MKKDSRNNYKSAFSGSDNVIYLNGELLCRIKQVLSEMFSDLSGLCEDNQIEYLLCGGSALGAVRHNGFIPWDDDIDIAMTRANYNKFISLYASEKSNEFREKYLLCTPESTHDHGLLFAQIKKRGTVLRSFNELSKPDDQCGLAIDIFVIENTFNSSALNHLHGFLCLFMGYISTCRKTYNDYRLIRPYISPISGAGKKFFIKALFGFFVSCFSLDSITKSADTVYSLCKDDHSKFVTIPSGRGHYFGEMLKREAFCTPKPAIFENKKAYIPAEASNYLSNLYGSDYMKIPEKKDREQHPVMEIKI